MLQGIGSTLEGQRKRKRGYVNRAKKRVDEDIDEYKERKQKPYHEANETDDKEENKVEDGQDDDEDDDDDDDEKKKIISKR